MGGVGSVLYPGGFAFLLGQQRCLCRFAGLVVKLIHDHYYLMPIATYLVGTSRLLSPCQILIALHPYLQQWVRGTVFILTAVVMLADADERCASNETPGQLKVCTCVPGPGEYCDRGLAS